MHANPGDHSFVQTGAGEDAIVRGGQMKCRANDDRLRGQEYDAIVYSGYHAVASQIAALGRSVSRLGRRIHGPHDLTRLVIEMALPMVLYVSRRLAGDTTARRADGARKIAERRSRNQLVVETWVTPFAMVGARERFCRAGSCESLGRPSPSRQTTSKTA